MDLGDSALWGTFLQGVQMRGDNKIRQRRGSVLTN
jgi:hypothetical protein